MAWSYSTTVLSVSLNIIKLYMYICLQNNNVDILNWNNNIVQLFWGLSNKHDHIDCYITMKGALTWQVHGNCFSGVSEIHRSIWDQRDYANVLDCSLAFTWLGTANELQLNGANPGTGMCRIFLFVMENETGEMCFFYLFDVKGI